MRLIDADAYLAEMKIRQDALKEMVDAARNEENWELYAKLSRAFGVFVEAKLVLNKQPTADVVSVVRCNDCKYSKKVGELCGMVKCTWDNWWQVPDFFCAYGERRSE